MAAPGFRLSLFVGVAATVVLLLSRSPFMMTTNSPSTTWADGPARLLAVPVTDDATKKDMFTSGATHMALLHNALLRGFNSIFQQAAHVRDADKADFVGYCLAWHTFLSSHHTSEEKVLFRMVEDVLEDKTIFVEAEAEHESFHAGLDEYHTYLSTLKSPKSLSAKELRRIMAGFLKPFEGHCHNEIALLSGLASHPKAPKPGSPEEAVAQGPMRKWGRNTIIQAGVTEVVPFLLLNTDQTAARGQWAKWPPIPPPVKWGLVNIAGLFHSGWWKFASCDAAGKPRELWALQFPERAD